MLTKEHRGSIFAILSGFLYGFIGYFGINAINGHLSVSTMLFWRFFIASGVILIVFFPKLKRTSVILKPILSAFLTGVIYYGLSSWFYFLACLYIGSGVSMVLFFTYPMLIMIINFFIYKQAIPKIYYLASVLILIGMLFLVDLNRLSFNLYGLILGVISAFFYAAYIIASKKNSLSPIVSTFMVCLGCTVTNLVISLINDTFVLPSSPEVCLHLLGIAIIATVIPILLMLYSLKYISSEKASILSVLEPVFVVIIGVLFLGESLRLSSAVGILLILSGAIITLLSEKLRVHLLAFNWLRSAESNKA